ncbi:hypothetical protein MKX54_20430 [Alkalihalobacillus sp. FSL R5-0424]
MANNQAWILVVAHQSMQRIHAVQGMMHAGVRINHTLVVVNEISLTVWKVYLILVPGELDSMHG